ncbi:MAG: ROK family protein [Chloroflexi bacterium]|nr:ROK family protein [Chloroflexota bacterium]
MKNLIYITVSTGIGGAGEIGHMTIEVDGPRCACGNTGCLEVLASGTAVAREAIRRLRDGKQIHPG